MPDNESTAYPIDPAAEQLHAAMMRAADRYFSACRERIPGFARTHFSYPGAWYTNKVAFGWDLLRMPINLLWAPLYLIIQLFALACQALHWPVLHRLLRKTPTGFTTKVQKQMVANINRQLLRNTATTADSEFHRYLIEELTTLANPRVNVNTQDFIQAIDPILNEALAQYAITRTASADITNTALSTALGALMLKKFTPGGLGFGLLIAAFVAKGQYSRDFIFGETLGNYYYALFPPSPSIALIAGCTLGVMCILAVIASFSGLLSDPIQYYTKLHHYRLKKFINHLERDFTQRSEATFKPKDQYLARIMEVLDTFKTQF